MNGVDNVLTGFLISFSSFNLCKSVALRINVRPSLGLSISGASISDTIILVCAIQVLVNNTNAYRSPLLSYRFLLINN